MMTCFCFFFSSRRRHTRWTGDWSSDVCSSDLRIMPPTDLPVALGREGAAPFSSNGSGARNPGRLERTGDDHPERSEERRVGKEWRAGWWPEDIKTMKSAKNGYWVTE